MMLAFTFPIESFIQDCIHKLLVIQHHKTKTYLLQMKFSTCGGEVPLDSQEKVMFISRAEHGIINCNNKNNIYTCAFIHHAIPFDVDASIKTLLKKVIIFLMFDWL